MNKNNTYNHKHLTLSDRIFIQQSLNDHLRFNTIAKSLNKDPSTISKEVRRSMEIQPSSHYKGNDCKHFDSCTESKLCSKGCFELCRFCNQVNCWEYCSNYEPSVCPGIKTPPYVCNGCTNVNSCSYEKHFYNAAHAQKLYETTLTQSRKGINMSPDELQKINELISPLIRSGQPLSHIYYNHSKEISCCRRTVYNYLDQGLFEVRNIDLPRRVRYKLRKKNKAANPVNYNYRSKRTYKDFEKYSEAFPDYEIVELDTVKGSREAGKCLLTMFFRKSSFMLIFLLPSCTQEAVAEAFNYLYEQLGHYIFIKTFRIILTDNGPEFKDPWSIEKAKNGKYRTKVFYCDPYASNQKGRLEKNHEFIRYVIPKGRTMQNLTHDDIRKLTCHINSVSRDSLNGKTPFDLAELLISKKVLHLLGLKKVSPDNVLLKPALLKK